jgi:hypothetical protein
MIEILKESTPVVVVAHFSGKVTGQEYQQFVDAVEERLKATDDLNLVLDLSGLEFYGDFEAAKKDFKFTLGEYKRVRKTALVGDQKWIEWYTRTIGHLTKSDEKHFPVGKTQEAFDWACA